MDTRYYRDVELLERSHVVVAEVTQPSLGVGYELGQNDLPVFRILMFTLVGSGSVNIKLKAIGSKSR